MQTIPTNPTISQALREIDRRQRRIDQLEQEVARQKRRIEGMERALNALNARKKGRPGILPMLGTGGVMAGIGYLVGGIPAVAIVGVLLLAAIFAQGKGIN